MNIFDFIYLFYIAMTQSFFVQFSALALFYAAAYFIKNPKPNFYYDDYNEKDTDA